ncbi:MAG TPA: hypothetical protein VGL97_04065 [Bryobacteraceae bacterium]|jgi:hypothetical protein
MFTEFVGLSPMFAVRSVTHESDHSIMLDSGVGGPRDPARAEQLRARLFQRIFGELDTMLRQ